MFSLRIGVVVTLACVLSGCINSANLVKVKPDGSGTVEQTLLVNMQALKGLMPGDPQGQTKTSGGVLNDAEFKRTAERMGVRPVSLTPLKDGAFEGAKAIYAFDDITKIRVDQDPPVSGSPAGAAFGKPESGSSPIRFGFARQGGASVLTIAVDEKMVQEATKNTSGGQTSMPTLDPAMMGMVKAMFQGFKIAIDLEVEGAIVKTNADYVSGSRITLVELDMTALLADEAQLQALTSKIGRGASISEARAVLKDVKGVKINHPTVTVEFK
jgi:hypothetical protein